MPRGLGLFIALVLAAGAGLFVWLAHPSPTDAGAMECPATGIVPESVSILSTNNGAGQVSAHVVRFQLCRATEATASVVANGAVLERPDKLGLLWNARQGWGEKSFSLSDASSAGITLSAVNNARRWPATTEISRQLGGPHDAPGGHHEGVAVKLTQEDLNVLGSASAIEPLALQFNIPVTAGMVNPNRIGQYRWEVALFHDSPNFCLASQAEATSKIVPTPTSEPTVHLSRPIVTAGDWVTVMGTGFTPFAPVERVTLGNKEWTYGLEAPAATIDAWGTFEFDILFPGFNEGSHALRVETNGEDAATEIVIYPSGVIPAEFGYRAERLKEILGDNFVRSFHYSPYFREWSFYDPELPETSNLRWLYSGKCYWILVKEPVDGMDRNPALNLTCTPEGNCWNLVVL